MRFLQNTKFFFCFLAFLVLGISSCGDASVDVQFNLIFENTNVQNLALTGTTVRVWYRYKQLGDNVRFQPAQSVPAVETIPGSDSQTRYEFSTASSSGFTVSSGGSVYLRNFPLGKEETEMGLEFLKPITHDSVTGTYVVAYGVYRAPTTGGLSEARLKADANTGLTIYGGRSCGRCSLQEAIDPAGADALFVARCGSGTNSLRACGWEN